LDGRPCFHAHPARPPLRLQRDVEAKHARLLEKRRMVRDLIMQQLALRRLVQKNSIAEQVAARIVPMLLRPDPEEATVRADHASGGGGATAGGGTAASPPALIGKLGGADLPAVLTAGLMTVDRARGLAARAAAGDAHESSTEGRGGGGLPAPPATAAASGDDAHIAPAAGRAVGVPGARPATAVKLPFLLVTTSSRATVNLEMDTVSHRQVILRFDSPFQVWDYKEVLKRMGLHDVSGAAGAGV
jgi:hypothetical protein